jgi:hypothetical protein
VIKKAALVIAALVCAVSASADQLKPNPVTGKLDLVGSGGGTGNVILASTQTHTGAKTFNSYTVFGGSVTAQNHAFSIGGSTLVVTGGNVGIGTTPATKLEVSGGTITVHGGGVHISTSGMGLTFPDGTKRTTNKELIHLTHPHFVELTNVSFVTSSNTFSHGQATFSNSISSQTNWVAYSLTVPHDIDTSVNLVVKAFKFKLGGADTGTHRYVIAMEQVADSAGVSSTPANATNAVNLDFAGDASGASGDIETISNVTLTGWASSMTAGRKLVIWLSRDGDATEDASTVNSVSDALVLEYGRN